MKKQADRIWILKGLSIMSVVCAHVAYDSSEIFGEKVALNLLNNVGTIGVIIFFLISGYFLSKNNDDTKIFWVKKWKYLVVPWIICGMLVYLHCFQLYNFRHWSNWYQDNIKNFQLIDCIKYLLGYNSLYYYMTMLLICFVVYRLIKNQARLTVLVTVVSLLLLVVGGGNKYIWGTPYMNPLNWLGYFGCGVCLGSGWAESIQNMIHTKLQRISVVIVLLDGILLGAMSWGGYIINYFNRMFIPFVLLQVLAISFLGEWIEAHAKLIRKILIELGKDSFYVYLLHMLMQSIPVKYLSGMGAVGILLRPVLLVFLTEILIKGFKFICKTNPWKR